jgi:hypothetical protein
MIRENRSTSSRWLGRRISGSCGGTGEAERESAPPRRERDWTGPKPVRDYNYVIRRGIEEK